MRTPATNEERNTRASTTLKAVKQLGKLAWSAPEQALAQAEDIEDPSNRVSALIAVAKPTQDMNILGDARDVLLGIELPGVTKNDKLTKIAFAAAGIDNRFAVETIEEITAPIWNAQANRQLSIAMTPSIKQRIEQDRMAEFNDYPRHVVAAFHEGVGETSYFPQPEASHQYVNLPHKAVLAAQLNHLDPIRDGGRVLDTFRDNPPFFSQMLDLISQRGLVA